MEQQRGYFEMSKEIKDLEGLKRHIEETLIEYSGISPLEINSNSMTIGTKSLLWRPNNFRRVVTAEFDRNSTLKKLRGAIGPTKVGQNQHNKLINFPYKGLTFQIGKNKITAIYSQSTISFKKMTYHIKADSWRAIYDRLLEKCLNIEQEMDLAIKEICKLIGAKKVSVATWSRHENWIKGEKYINSLPKDLIIHDTVFKKVYSTGVEFVKSNEHEAEPGVFVKNYLKNRAVEDFAPEIQEGLNDMTIDFSKKFNSMTDLMEGQIKQMETFRIAMKEHLALIGAIKAAVNQMSNTNNETTDKLINLIELSNMSWIDKIKRWLKR